MPPNPLTLHAIFRFKEFILISILSFTKTKTID
jgi:predicted dehydrogenase